MIVGYLDNNKRDISIEEQRNVVDSYAQSQSLDIDVFFEEDDINNIINNISSKDSTVIIANVASLGNKLTKIVKNIETFIASGFTIVSVKENLIFDNSNKTYTLLEGVKLSIDIRNSMVSTIIIKAIHSRRARGMSRRDTAKHVNVSIASLYNFLRVHPELKEVVNG